MNHQIVQRVKELQSTMAEPAAEHLIESRIGHLRLLVKLTVEFEDYLTHGSVEVSARLVRGRLAEHIDDAETVSQDPWNRYDLEFVCNSIMSGVDSFCSLNIGYGILDNATGSTVSWGALSSRESLKERFLFMFEEFVKEGDFERRCRLLLDLFKLQMIFATINS